MHAGREVFWDALGMVEPTGVLSWEMCGKLLLG